MTFQRRTAERLMYLLRKLKPGVKIVVGGYDPSLDYDAYLSMPVDFIVRGEGEVTFASSHAHLKAMAACTSSPVCRTATPNSPNHVKWIHNSKRAPHRLEDNDIRLPRRDARVLKGYTMLGRQVDVIETSRGCTL